MGRWRVSVKYLVISIWELIGFPYSRSARPYPEYDALKEKDPTGFGGEKNANVVIIQLAPNFNSCLPFTQLRAWLISQMLLIFRRPPLLSPRAANPLTLMVDMPGPPILALGMPYCSATFPIKASATLMYSSKRENPARNS